MSEPESVPPSPETPSPAAIQAWLRRWHRRELLLGEPSGQPLRTIGVRRAGVTDLPRMARGQFYYQGPTPVHLVMVTADGEASCRGGERRWELEPGSVIFFPRGAKVVLRVRSKVWRVIWFLLDETSELPGLQQTEAHVEQTPFAARLERAMEGMFTEAGLAEAKKGDFTTTDLGSAEVLDASSSRHDVTRGHSVEAGYLYARIVRSHLEELLSVERADWNDDARRLERVLARVRARLDRNWSVELLAAEARVSPATLHRLTHRFLGRAPGEVLLDLRMQKGRTLLSQTNWPLKRVAEHLGYGSRSSFSMAFKRHVGMSPSDYRRTHAA